MRALLVRHAIAEDRAVDGGRDEDRPLTTEGRRRMRAVARALEALVPELALVATSPLLRARQTAEIVRDAHAASPGLFEVPELAPDGRPPAVLAFLQTQKGLAAVALVGHEPNLSLLEGYLLAGRERSLAVFKKGGAALLEFPGRLAAGGASLLWHLTAGQLRDLARGSDEERG